MSQSNAVVIEPAEGNVSAHVPDLPGCVATGATRDAVLGLAADAKPAPHANTSVTTMTV